MNNFDDTMDVAEAAAMLRAEVATVLQYARRGDLPGTRIGKSWVFLREDVMSFLREQIAKDTEERRQHAGKNIVAALAVRGKRQGRRTAPPVLPDLPFIASKKLP